MYDDVNFYKYSLTTTNDLSNVLFIIHITWHITVNMDHYTKERPNNPSETQGTSSEQSLSDSD